MLMEWSFSVSDSKNVPYRLLQGHLSEWLGLGLQNRSREFDSRSDLYDKETTQIW